MSGRSSEVGGILSVTIMRKTVMESSVVMPMEIFSPESEGM